eukprot:855738-Prymnesium_polylepis.1
MHVATVRAFSKEAIRAHTAVVLWYRQVQILQLSSWTGSFCYLIVRIMQVRAGAGCAQFRAQ